MASLFRWGDVSGVRHGAALRYRIGMASSHKQHKQRKQQKQHLFMQPNSKTGRRLAALPIALRQNGPWTRSYGRIHEFMTGRGTACSNSRGAGAGS
jgi:hypothetical protein